MLTLGLNEFLRNLKINIIAIVQLIVLFVVIMISTSTCYEQYRLYGCVAKNLDKTGMVLYPYSLGPRSTDFEDLIDVESVTYAEGCIISDGKSAYEIYTYDPDSISYKPYLLSGVWCEKGLFNDEYIRVCISDAFTLNVGVGDTFQIGEYRFYVTGIFDNSELVYTTDCNHSSETSYMNFYQEASAKEYPLMVAAYKDVHRFIDDFTSSVYIVDYKDSISDEAAELNKSKLEDMGYLLNADMIDAKEIYEYSETLFSIKVAPMYALMAVVLLFAIISIWVTGSIAVLDEKRNYGIYFLSGNNWKNTIYISVIHHGIEILTALIMALIIWCIIIHSPLKENINTAFYMADVAALFGASVFIELCSVLMPYIMLHKLQPIATIRQG